MSRRRYRTPDQNIDRCMRLLIRRRVTERRWRVIMAKLRKSQAKKALRRELERSWELPV